MTDSKYMEMAIELAARGAGYTSPNPMVGAVIVKDGQIIGAGYHERCGQLHAERNALADCRRRGNDPEGAAIYVTLEPCCHYGKTPPCTEAIIENKLAKVIIGSRDPNPLVSGKGARILRKAGIQVTEDFMREECDALNPVFFHYITTGLPYVVLKYAMTMDGKIATWAGNSKWITGETARANVHWDRHRLTGIMVGVGTVIKDDPMLTCRLEDEQIEKLHGGQPAATGGEQRTEQCPKQCPEQSGSQHMEHTGGKNPVRIICDTHLRTPLDAKVVTTTEEARTIIACSCPDRDRQQPYLDAGCEIVTVGKNTEGHLDLRELMKKLAEQSVDSILLEGGGQLNWSALEAGIVTRVQAYIAPKLFGGADAKTPVAGSGVEFPSQAVTLENLQIRHLGEDILIESEVKPCLQASSKK